MKANVLVATVVGGIVYFVLGFLIYGLALDSFMKGNTVPYAGLMKDPPNLVILFLANLAWAFILAFIFDRLAGIKDAARGAQAGGLIMALTALAIDLQNQAFMNIYGSWMVVLVDVIAVGVMSAITGAVIGFLLGKIGRTES